MPELPEVETIAHQLRAELNGKTIQDVRVFWKRSVQGDINDFKKNLIGLSIRGINRRGKYICFCLDRHRHLTLHLGMTGKLLFSLAEKERKHLRIEFTLDQGLSLYFHDIRKFGKARIWEACEPLLPRLGREPLDKEIVLQALQSLKTNRAMKNVLLDQQILAGIGNIYADEALFRAGIHPLKPAAKVNPDKLKYLSEVIPIILQQAIDNMGTTISNYRPPNHPKGKNQQFLKVYGREGHCCDICGTKIKKIRINNRSSNFCPRCQPDENV
ncbi:MAG: DNA-formamidopyrimidine glycosylase [Candidatus Aminicenantes bacterium]|nr:DNA-formamidopyrimidine glycosylase [Candidatus Aminicenantes bacterium]